MDRYLEIAGSHGIRTCFVLFDDCWNQDPSPGQQSDPRPGVHNSGWVQSPGTQLVTDSSGWARLEDYATGVVSAFASDERVLMWDLYNEPGNSGLGDKSLPLLKQAFAWARAAAPTQPLTVGLWYDIEALNALQLAASDVITFHNYNDVASLSAQIDALRSHGRPLICTEYMARTRGSRFATHLPVFRRERVGCYNWGLVSGRTQTIYAWGHEAASAEPEVWFHDIFRRDGTPYDDTEVALIQRLALGEA
jgi:hypothetical protein